MLTNTIIVIVIVIAMNNFSTEPSSSKGRVIVSPRSAF